MWAAKGAGKTAFHADKATDGGDVIVPHMLTAHFQGSPLGGPAASGGERTSSATRTAAKRELGVRKAAAGDGPAGRTAGGEQGREGTPGLLSARGRGPGLFYWYS